MSAAHLADDHSTPATLRPIEGERRKRHPFVQCPKGLGTDPRLGPGAVRLYLVLKEHDGPRGCYPRHKRLAELLGVSQDTIERAQAQLERAGWIVIDRAKRRINRYRFPERPAPMRVLESHPLRPNGAAPLRPIRAAPPRDKNKIHGNKIEENEREKREERE